MRLIDKRYRIVRGHCAEITGERTFQTDAEGLEWATAMTDDLGWDDWQLEADDGRGWFTVAFPSVEDQGRS